MHLFEFFDYRKYLAYYYQSQKATKRYFSYQTFANRARFSNKGFLYNIIKGAKNLSKSNIFNLSKAIGHTPSETEYFENLVSFNQARNPDEQNYHYQKLCAIRRAMQKTDTSYMVREDQYEFYAHWYHAAVWSLIDMHGFSNNYQWLAKMVSPPLSQKQAKQSVALLERIGLIKLRENGSWETVSKSLSPGVEVRGMALRNLRLETLKLAADALVRLPREVRNMPSLVLGISEEGYKRIVEELDIFQRNILNIAENDQQADRVYQFDFSLFPLSRINLQKGKNS